MVADEIYVDKVPDVLRETIAHWDPFDGSIIVHVMSHRAQHGDGDSVAVACAFDQVAVRA
jgi:hypothetical protein